MTFDQQIACVRRELAMRRSVYAKRVTSGPGLTNGQFL
jgi:hypothetical protein